MLHDKLSVEVVGPYGLISRFCVDLPVQNQLRRLHRKIPVPGDVLDSFRQQIVHVYVITLSTLQTAAVPSHHNLRSLLPQWKPARLTWNAKCRMFSIHGSLPLSAICPILVRFLLNETLLATATDKRMQKAIYRCCFKPMTLWHHSQNLLPCGRCVFVAGNSASSTQTKFLFITNSIECSYCYYYFIENNHMKFQ